MAFLSAEIPLDLNPVSIISSEPQIVQNDFSPISRRPQYRSHHHSMQLDIFGHCLAKRQPPALVCGLVFNRISVRFLNGAGTMV